MRPVPFRPVDEEFRVECDTPRRGGVELDHPAVDALRIELRVDRAVERVGEINAPAVAADLHHLRSTIELAVLRTRVGRARHDPSNPHLSGELRVEWIRHVVLLQVAGAPARDVEEAVVHGQIDVGDQWGNRLEALELMFFAEVDFLQVLALGEVPEMQAPAVFAAEQNFRDETVLKRIWRAPLAGDHRVVAEMPPYIVTELLRPAIDLPAAERLETLLIHDEHAARCFAVFVSQRCDIDAPGSAVDGVRAGIAGLFGKLRRLDHLHDFRRTRIGLGVENVDARRAQTGHDEITSLHMGMWRVRTQARRARVPAEMVEFVPGLRRRHVADDLGIRRRFRIDVDDRQAVRRSAVRIEGGDVGERFGRCLCGLPWRGIKTRIRRPSGHVLSPRGWSFDFCGLCDRAAVEPTLKRECVACCRPCFGYCSPIESLESYGGVVYPVRSYGRTAAGGTLRRGERRLTARQPAMNLAQNALRYGGRVAARARDAAKTREERRPHVPPTQGRWETCAGVRPLTNFTFWGRLPTIQAALREQNER